MKRFCFILEYEGSDFFGWQTTKMGPSVESTLHDAFKKILKITPSLSAASRTDRGVHARGQIVKIDDPIELKESLEKTFFRINAIIPRSMRIPQVGIVPESFHPTLDNCGKIYHYHLFTGNEQPPTLRPYSWHVPSKNWNLDLLEETTTLLEGTNDFSSFCNERKDLPKDKVRTLHKIELIQKSEHHWVLSFYANSFLYKMARNLAGSIVDVLTGKLTPEQLRIALLEKDRRFAGVTAPAHGLFLEKVLFPEDPFEEIFSI